MDGGRPPTVVVDVAVGVLRDAAGRVLLARRAAHKHQGGMWEFPGGKVEAGEALLDALRRELREELDIAVEEAAFWFTREFGYPDRRVALHVCTVQRFRGVPRGLEGQPLRWAAPAQLDALPIPAANRIIAKALQGDDAPAFILPEPPLYLIADPARCAPERFFPILEAALEGGVRWLQLRLKDRPEADAHALIEGVLALARPCGAKVLLNGDPERAAVWGADGVHLSQKSMQSLAGRRADPSWGLVGVSCHDAAELDAAAALGAHFALLSPVYPTASHPDAPALGLARFGDILQRRALPVLALGGIWPARIPELMARGAAGVAVLGGIMEAPDPRKAARAFLRQLGA